MSAIKTVTSSSSAAAAAACQGRPSGIRNLMNRIAYTVADIFFIIREGLIGVSKGNRDIYASLKPSMTTTLDISGQLRKESARTTAPGQPWKMDSKSWMLNAFDRDMSRNFHTFTVISKDGKTLFDGANDPSPQKYQAFLTTFKKLFGKHTEFSRLVQIFCTQSPQASFLKELCFQRGWMQKRLFPIVDPQRVVLKQETDDRVQIAWLYNMETKSMDKESLKVPFGTCEYISTLHKKQDGQWTVSQEIQNPTPVRSWTTILGVVTGVAAAVFAVYSKFRS